MVFDSDEFSNLIGIGGLLEFSKYAKLAPAGLMLTYNLLVECSLCLKKSFFL